MHFMQIVHAFRIEIIPFNTEDYFDFATQSKLYYEYC